MYLTGYYVLVFYNEFQPARKAKRIDIWLMLYSTVLTEVFRSFFLVVSMITIDNNDLTPIYNVYYT